MKEARHNKLKKGLCLLLVLTMTMGLLSACGDNTDDPKINPTPDAAEYVYVPTYARLSGNISYINQSCYSNGRIFFNGQIETGETITQSYSTGMFDENGEPIMEEYSYEETRNGIFSVALDGSDFRELEGYKIENIVQDPDDPYSGYSYTNVNRLFADSQGNLWVLENVYTTTFNLPDDFVESEASNAWEYAEQKDEYYLVKLDENGTELSRTDLVALVESTDEYFYVNNVAIDNDGNMYLAASGKIYVLDSEGQKLFNIELTDSWVDSVFTTADGRTLASFYDQSSEKQIFKTIDMSAKGFGQDSYPVPYGAYNFMPGNAEYDYYYDNGTSLFGGSLETGETEKIITWINCDVDGNNINSVIPMEDGRIIAMSTSYEMEGDRVELVTMNLTPTSEVAQKEKIIYACMWLDYTLRSEIISFNRTNPKYRIEVQDYSEYNTQDNYSAGQTKLTTEILTGKVPDIFSTNGLPIAQYGAKGVLEDLWPFIESDTGLGGRDGVVQPVFDAISTDDGKLYQLVSSAAIFTVLGASSVVGDTPGWTVADAKAALATMPEGCEMFSIGTTQSDVMNQMCYMSLDGFVNWQTGKCSFDSDEFIQLLEFSKMFPESFDWEAYYEGNDWMYEEEMSRIMQGRQMLNASNLYRVGRYLMYKKAFGGDVTAIGFPGSGTASAFVIDGGLAMSASCKNKEGAWEFMRILLDEEYQSEYGYNGIPTSKKAFDAMFTGLMTPEYYVDYETGEQKEYAKESWWIDDDNTIEIFAMTQEEKDEVMDLINNTTRIFTYDESLYEIIFDETAAFFAGQKTAEDTAKNVQSRVSLYVNEQR